MLGIILEFNVNFLYSLRTIKKSNVDIENTIELEVQKSRERKRESPNKTKDIKSS